MSTSFPTTRRSVVLALASGDAGERTRGFDTLVTLYWKPLYKYARVSSSRSAHDCEDLTQSFFTRIFESDALSAYDPAKASFRTFLRLLFDRHAANEFKSSQRLKRGGGQRALDFESAEAEIGRESTDLTGEEYFHREWVRSVFAAAVERLREECETRGKSLHFALFENYDLDDSAKRSYRELGELHGVSETTVTNYLSATRKEFRRIVLETLREATASEQEFRSEARALLGVEA